MVGSSNTAGRLTHTVLSLVAKLGHTGLIAIITALWAGNNVLQCNNRHSCDPSPSGSSSNISTREKTGANGMRPVYAGERGWVCVLKKKKKGMERERKGKRGRTDPDGRQRRRRMREGMPGIKGLLGWETFLSWHDTKWLKCASVCV